MRRGTAGEAAALLASAEASLLEAAGAPPPRLAHGAAAQTAEVAHGGFRRQGLEDAVQEAIATASSPYLPSISPLSSLYLPISQEAIAGATAAAAEANAAAAAAAATDGRRRRRRPFEPNQSQVAAPLCALLTTNYYEYSTYSLLLTSYLLLIPCSLRVAPRHALAAAHPSPGGRHRVRAGSAPQPDPRPAGHG